MPATTNAAGSESPNDSVISPVPKIVWSTCVVYAPAMMNSPWAMLMTFICPKVNVSPRPTSSRIDPMLTPTKSCWMIVFHRVVLLLACRSLCP